VAGRECSGLLQDKIVGSVGPWKERRIDWQALQKSTSLFSNNAKSCLF